MNSYCLYEISGIDNKLKNGIGKVDYRQHSKTTLMQLTIFNVRHGGKPS